MTSRRPLILAAMLALATAAGTGCVRRSPATQAASPVPARFEKLRDIDPQLPRSTRVGVAIHLRIFTLTVPRGALSGNAEFWSRVDSTMLDPPVRDNLLRNGLRVGVAPQSEWGYFKSIIDAMPSAIHLDAFTGYYARSVEVPLRGGLLGQDLFYFDRAGRIDGRSFDRCENLLAVSFQPSPIDPGTARITVMPIVRTQRTRLEFSPLNDPRDAQFVQPETPLDVDLRIPTPLGHLLVIGPSPQADRLTSLGAAFLLDGSPPERSERVLLIVPMPFRTDDPDAAPATFPTTTLSG